MKLFTQFKILSIYSIVSLIFTYVFIQFYPTIIGKYINFYEDHERSYTEITIPRVTVSWKLIKNTNNNIVDKTTNDLEASYIGMIEFNPYDTNKLIQKINLEELLFFNTNNDLPSNSRTSNIKAVNYNGDLRIIHEGLEVINIDSLKSTITNFLTYYNYDFNQQLNSHLEDNADLNDILKNSQKNYPKLSKDNFDELIDQINFQINCHYKAIEILSKAGDKIVLSEFFSELDYINSQDTKCFIFDPYGKDNFTNYDQDFLSNKIISKSNLLKKINRNIYDFEMEKKESLIQIASYLRNFNLQKDELLNALLYKKITKLRNLLLEYKLQHENYLNLNNSIIKNKIIKVSGKRNYIYPIHYLVIFIIILFILLSLNSLINSRARNEK